MDELELLAKRAERTEQAAADELAAEFEEVDKPEEKPKEKPLPPSELAAGAKRAEVILGVLSMGLENFGDPRLELPPEEYAAGRKNLGPALAKYGLTGGGDGDIPYAVEVRAGFYLGGLIKRTWRRIKALIQHDNEQREQREKEARQHGEKSQYQTAEPPHAVSGEFGFRQESDTAEPIVNS